MDIEKSLQEMARELLPNVSPEDDLAIIKELKKLYKKDRMEFNKKLRRINLVRKSESLEALTREEILKGYVKKAIKANTQKDAKTKKIIEASKYSGLSFKPGRKETKQLYPANQYDAGTPIYNKGKLIGRVHVDYDDSKITIKKYTIVDPRIKHKIINRKLLIFPELKEKITLFSVGGVGYVADNLKIKSM